MKRLSRPIWWLLPVLFLGWLYSDSLRIWFREDDFPLLAFSRTVHDLPSFFHFLVIPYAQGTIRPFSERLPFLISRTLFDLDSLPFRIAVMATVAADLCILTWIVRRLTGSRFAGLAAALFWVTGASLVSPMTWDSSYNEVQHPLFLLGALACFIRYADTGKPRYWWAQVAIFVLGFGSLETNIVYPGIAAAWVLLVADPAKRKQLLRGTVPLLCVALVYFFIHQTVVAPPVDPFYTIHVDLRIARTFWEYWRWAFLPPGWTSFGYPYALGVAILIASMASLLLFLAAQLLRRRVAVLFGMAWFLLTIGPLLLLPDRHTEYYLCVPTLGLAMLAGWGVSIASRAGWQWRLAAAVPAALWFAGMIPVTRAATRIYVDESRLSRSLLMGIRAAHDAHPDRAIILDGVTDREYRIALAQRGFKEVGVESIYLTPGAENTIHADPDDPDFPGMILDPAVAVHALAAGKAVVYEFASDHLRNITRAYTMRGGSLSGAQPRRVEVGNPLYSYLIGPEWMPPQGGVRWMPAIATLKMAGPSSTDRHLAFNGYCTAAQLAHGPLSISLSADGIPLGSTSVVAPEIHFRREFPLPPSLVGHDTMQVRINVSPTTKVGVQDYGALLGEINLHR